MKLFRPRGIPPRGRFLWADEVRDDDTLVNCKGVVHTTHAKGNAMSNEKSVIVLPIPPKHICPVCGKPPVEKYRPFCGARCADIDLGKWLGERYRVETNEEPENQTEKDLEQ